MTSCASKFQPCKGGTPWTDGVTAKCGSVPRWFAVSRRASAKDRPSGQEYNGISRFTPLTSTRPTRLDRAYTYSYSIQLYDLTAVVYSWGLYVFIGARSATAPQHYGAAVCAHIAELAGQLYRTSRSAPRRVPLLRPTNATTQRSPARYRPPPFDAPPTALWRGFAPHHALSASPRATSPTACHHPTRSSGEIVTADREERKTADRSSFPPSLPQPPCRPERRLAVRLYHPPPTWRLGASHVGPPVLLALSH